jgi:hypothetical protein
MPFGLVPTPVALQIAVLEYAYHRWDLEHALGNIGHQLPPDIAPHAFAFAAGFLPMLLAAGTVPAAPLAFRLAAPGDAMVLEHAADGWHVVDQAHSPVCEISGAPASLALFTMGRLRPDSDGTSVAGYAADEASCFKTYFPGP